MVADDEYTVLGELPKLGLLPSRTALYGLKPIGLGSGVRESLTSYIERLADAHCVSLRFLAQVPSFDAISRERFRHGGPLYIPCFNAGGFTSMYWATVFMKLTGRAELEALTLAPIARIVNHNNLTSRERRWCPECLREAEAAGVPYGQLIWEIAYVSACPIHEIEISGQCICTSAPGIRRSPGHCSRCGRRLSAVLPRRKARPEDVRIARAAHDLLADPRFDNGGWQLRDDRSGEFLRSVAAIHYGGRQIQLAKALGLCKGSLHQWLHSKNRPPLTLLIALADRLGCSVADVLDARAQATHPPAGPIIRRRRGAPVIVTETQRTMIAERVTSAVSDPVPASLKALAKQLQVNQDFLSRKFPAESTVIAARFKAHQTTQRIAREQKSLCAVREKVRQLIEQGVPLTAKRVRDGNFLPARYGVLWRLVNQVVAEMQGQMRTATPGSEKVEA